MRKIITVRRWEIGLDGTDAIVVVYNRVKRITIMQRNGVLEWKVGGIRAEGYFNKYGLLIN